MTVTADPLEKLLTDPPADGDYSHWAFPPYEVAICGAEVDKDASQGEMVGLKTCPRCEYLGRLLVDHGIWEGSGPRPKL